MLCNRYTIYFLLIVVKFDSLESSSRRRSGSSVLSGLQKRPPPVKYGFNRDIFDPHAASKLYDGDDNLGFEWEKSGLYEGDIMYYEHDDKSSKNVLIDEKYRWPNSTVSFYIEEDQFNKTEVETILQTIQEFHRKTCVRFKPYDENDKNWIFISGSESGCWSSIGMQEEGGQQLNVNSPKCVKKGIVMHEMLHALGLAHQQSASNRDEYVKILWENISEGHEHNFNKYNESVVTDFGYAYDYLSIMHYSGKAFSKNTNDTIVARKPKQTLGQRNGFTEVDISKVNKMYSSPCHMENSEEDPFNFQNYDDVTAWFEQLHAFL